VSPARSWQRRARPLLGTLVEIGLPASAERGRCDQAQAAEAFEGAFAAIAHVQACMSRFDPASDVARFNALRPGESLRVRPATADVLAKAEFLRAASGGLFDISLGTAPEHWGCVGGVLTQGPQPIALDMGGIAKGHAVDRAVDALIARGCPAGWVNAGGDLRVFGDAVLPVHLRSEAAGGARPFARLSEGAFATSALGPGQRCQLHRAGGALQGLRHGLQHRLQHLSVAAPLCVWADGLTKVVAASGNSQHPLLKRLGAEACIHASPNSTPQAGADRFHSGDWH
jgi:thiamine biosynthesis lipoprotein